MYEYYIYLIMSENRLIICDHQIINSDYYMLMNNNGNNNTLLYDTCKIFCLGYIYGTYNELNKPVVNKPIEFQ